MDVKRHYDPRCPVKREHNVKAGIIRCDEFSNGDWVKYAWCDDCKAYTAVEKVSLWGIEDDIIDRRS